MTVQVSRHHYGQTLYLTRQCGTPPPFRYPFESPRKKPFGRYQYEDLISRCKSSEQLDTLSIEAPPNLLRTKWIFGASTILRKIMVSVKMFAILGRKWLRQFYGRLKTSMPIKFPVFGGGTFFLGGGGGADYIFMGARIFFLILGCCERVLCFMGREVKGR